MSAKKTYDDWISTNYDGLLRYAKRYHRHPHDLLHSVYLRIRELPNLQQILDGKPWGYHILAMFRQAKMGTFKKQYQILDIAVPDVAEEIDNRKVLCREELDLVLARLPWFDRTLFELRLEGQNLVDLAKESGISQHTIYYSIRKTTQIIKDHFDVHSE